MRWSIIRTFPLYGKSVWKWNKKFHNNLLPFLVCWIIDSLVSAKNNYKHKHFSGEIRKLRRTVWSGSTKSLKWLQKVSTITAEPPLVLSSFLLLKTNINKKKYDDIPTSAWKSSIRMFVSKEKAPTRGLLGPSPGWKGLLPLSHLRHY